MKKHIFTGGTAVLLSVLLSLCTLFPALGTIAAAEGEEPEITPEDSVISVNLLEGEENAEQNWYLLSNAACADTEQPLRQIRIEPSGTYYVGKTASTGAIRLRSNTELDLNGSTLVRYNQMGNFFQNCDDSGETHGGKEYGLSQNITIKNGTVDGTFSENDTVNLLNFGHAKNIHIENIRFIGNGVFHLIEFTGCRYCIIQDCTFEGISRASKYTDAVEALQFDICDADSGVNTWNGVYCTDPKTDGDETPCRDMTVDNCEFINYPSAIGNHKGIEGVFSTKIAIQNCNIHTDIPSSCAAIWAYNFSNSTISGNTVSGKYEVGMRVSGGSGTTLQNNTVTTPGTCLHVTVASSSYEKNSHGVKKNEYTKKLTVSNNHFTDSGKAAAVCIFGSAHMKAFSGNTVMATNEKALTITSGAKADAVSGNTLTSKTLYGIHLSGTAVGKITKNKITAKDRAIQLGSGAVVTEISSNTLTSSAQTGIQVSGSTAKTVSANKISAPKADGMAFSNSSKATTVSGNTISGSGANGIRVSASAVSNILSNKITSSKQNAISLTSKAKATNVKGNVIKTAAAGIYASGATITTVSNNTLGACKQSGIKATSTGVIKKVFGNAVSGSKDYGIRLNKSGITVQIGNNALKGNAPGGVKNNGKTKAIHKVGFQKIGSNTYYFTAKGAVKTGWQNLKNAKKKTCTYYFNKYGIMQKGFQNIKNSKGKAYTYYFGADGALLKGMQKMKGADGSVHTYYFNKSGIMQKGFQKISAKTYYFNGSGMMLTGWQKIKTGGKVNTYCFSGKGVMYTGKATIGGVEYTFTASGICKNPPEQLV